MTTVDGPYDEALERFNRTGPEFEGFLSNHGPMVVELLARRGEDDRIHRWTDNYLRRLDELPRAVDRVDAANWREALGRFDRAADWIAFLQIELSEASWRDVLARWWPRLLPGIAAGATHGVIRTGHAVRALLDEETDARRAEFGHALGYWAARYLPVPALAALGARRPAEVFAALPRIADQDGSVPHRLGQLDTTEGWLATAATARVPESDADVPAALALIVDDAVHAYAAYAVGDPTMLVHAATAPNAVAATLPALPESLWRASFDAAWAASAAMMSAYAPKVAAEVSTGQPQRDDVFDRALRHGGEHVLKFVDVALASHARTSSSQALVAAQTAVDLDA